MHGLNRVNGLEDDDDDDDDVLSSSNVFSDRVVVSGVAGKITVGVGRCCDGADVTKPWMGRAQDNMVNIKVARVFIMMATAAGWFNL